MFLPNDSMVWAEQFLLMNGSFLKIMTYRCVFLVEKHCRSSDCRKELATLQFPISRIYFLNILSFIISLAISRKISYDYICTSHVYTTGIIGFRQIFKLFKNEKIGF